MPRDVLVIGKSFVGAQEFECECTASGEMNTTASTVHKFVVESTANNLLSTENSKLFILPSEHNYRVLELLVI